MSNTEDDREVSATEAVMETVSAARADSVEEMGTASVKSAKTDFAKGNYVYMVRCKDGSLYTGWTNNLDKRIRMHNEGKGAKYTRSRRPVELVYAERFETKEAAMSREAAIKKMAKKEKEEMVEKS